MKLIKYSSIILFWVLVSCANKEDILLPKASTTIVSEVTDHSPIYVFFRKNEKDTLAEVNRKNSIISTNWILNIYKRLPLRLVIPEVMKLQEKKRADVAHKNEKAENYYSYSDSIGKNLAFLAFTKVYYKMEKPKVGIIVFFNKNNVISIDNLIVKKKEVQNYVANLTSDNSKKIFFCFAKDLSYDKYIQNKIFIQSLKIENIEEFIY